jgi:signal transduction histidine kinase
LFGTKKIQALESLAFKDREHLNDIRMAEQALRNKIRLYVLIAGILLMLLTSGLLYRNVRNKQKANEAPNTEKTKVENALETLKATQSQLVQREKMASLGELTAGIAHEIQNPLNFVNNFSEVNTELITELRETMRQSGDGGAEEVLGIIADNEQKILHHGKRADAIVKGMLQHSRSTTGEKQSADINALTEEYLRLAYHGLRAKDKSFQCNYKFSPHPSIRKVNIVPQDIGRVLLNLINNAFYAVQNKTGLGIANYEPMVEVSTSGSGQQVILTVKDNGNGIPQAIRQKIFQPFFTTKPTGEGTGLGLSLSYDIVKAYGGEFRVESTKGEGSEFIIMLPMA